MTNRLKRTTLALGIGLLFGVACYLRLVLWQKLAADFTFPWRAAQFLLSGENPYLGIYPSGDYPFQTFFYYPLTSALSAIPFAPLSPYLAGALFFGLSSGLLAFVLLEHGWRYLPLFLSAPFFVALATVQWAPLVMAAALFPPLGWLMACKPNLGLAMFAYRPTILGALLVSAFLILSLVIQPSWPLDWIELSSDLTGHPPPFLVLPFGPLLLLSLFHWRKPDGRLLLALSLFPQYIFFYDQLPLWLLPRGFKSTLVYSGLSWAAYLAWRLLGLNQEVGEITLLPTQFIIGLIYLPALLILFWPDTIAPMINRLRLRLSNRSE